MMKKSSNDPDPSGAKAHLGAAPGGTARSRALPEQASSRWDSEVRVLAWLAMWVSVFSFLFYFRRGDALLYGDAIAHINIARRVFDSRTPGLLQLGTVWLPLPHLLMIPFLVSNEMWRRGVGGSIPSMVAYVFGVLGMFRLVRGTLSRGVLSCGVLSQDGKTGGATRIAAWTAAAVYAANPNLIYMQSTAMGEALYLALFIWAVVFFSEFVRGDAKALTKCGLCLAAACLTRYDGWFLAAAIVAGVLFSYHAKQGESLPSHPLKSAKGGAAGSVALSRRLIFKFVLLAGAGPALWLGYNAMVYRNPLEFADGPYSARAIERKTGTVNPSKGSLYAAGSYFLKAAELNVAESAWLGRLWLLLAVAGAAVGFFTRAGRWPLLLLWLPLPFYGLSLAYGGVPIFVPPWWPFSFYNLRYGLELLPAFAAGLAMLMHQVVRRDGLIQHRTWRRVAAGGILAIVVISYGAVWHSDPVCYREAAINMRGRVALEKPLADWLHALPAQATLLMDLGGHPGALEQAGIPLRRTINEGNHRVWIRPADPEGLWERALANPAALADYALAFEGDEVWRAVQGRHFRELVEIKVTGQPRAVLFRLR
jgi:hypothetical protein